MKVILGVAAIRGDEAVLRLCRRASQEDARQIFSQVLVVDSLGGLIAEALQNEFDPDYVHYRNHRQNLGAAGNLEKRLLWGAEAGGAFLYAINSDGDFDLTAVESLLDYALRHDCGAVYPVTRLASDCYELTGMLGFPWRPVRRSEKELPTAESMTVSWSSSNGALYSLRPAGQGIVAPAGLWHGWEDLAYGLLLKRAGYRQAMLPATRIEARYEVRSIGSPMGSAETYGYLSDKPSWLAYYTSRNLLLIATRIAPAPRNVVAAMTRIFIELLVTLVYRDRKLERLRYLARGLRDGILGRWGMVVAPQPQ